MTRRLAIGHHLLAAILVVGAMAPWARAGGGPENVFLVVNANSWASVTVANHFIALRAIPPINVLYLDWEDGFETVDGDTFRQKIMQPVIAAMEKRGVFHQIDYIVYSSDLPYAISLYKDFEGKVKLPDQARPTVSINSATYLWHMTMVKLYVLMGFDINQYMRSFHKPAMTIERQVEPPSHGFRSWYGWDRVGRLQEAGGQPYMLSTMLAMTSGRGNSVGEAIRYLTSAAGADGTFPKGTIYFTRTSDVRSTTRQDEFAPTIEELAKLGVRGQVVSTPMPVRAGDVMGLLSGAESFNWSSTGSKILPGAICDNFTSFGGIMTEGAGQTPLTEFLRYGAAGAAGTVIEPYALPHKFASANIFLHYARGCTLAESYYQSLFGPAQVLIVGDPLCRPWANIPQVRVGGVEPGAEVSGTLTLKVEARFPREAKVQRFELFVDGRRAGRCDPGESLTWDSATECDGYHELRVVAIEDGPIETQGRAVIPVTVKNDGRTATLATSPAGKVRWDQTLQIAVKAPGTKQTFVLNNGRLLGSITGEQGVVRLQPRVLGEGPVQLQAISLIGSGYRDRVIPKPVSLVVEPGTPLPAISRDAGSLAPGMLLRLPDNKVVPVQDTKDANWLQASGVSANQPFALQGYFQVPATGTYQFQIWHHGSLELSVDDERLYSGRDGKYQQQFVPVSLAAGLHKLTISGRTGSSTNSRILFGGPGSTSLDGTRFQHPKRS